MSEDFLEVIADAIQLGCSSCAGDDYENAPLEYAKDILTLPEMQAIKASLIYLSIDKAMFWEITKEDALRRMGLPETVVWWVLQKAEQKEGNYDD